MSIDCSWQQQAALARWSLEMLWLPDFFIKPRSVASFVDFFCKTKKMQTGNASRRSLNKLCSRLDKRN